MFHALAAGLVALQRVRQEVGIEHPPDLARARCRWRSRPLVMAALALLFERHRPIVWTPTSIGSLAYLSVFGSAVTFTLYYWLLRHARASRVALIAYATPVIAVATGVLFLDEPSRCASCSEARS